MLGFDWGFGWVRSQFGSWSRCVGLKILFWVSEGWIWLRSRSLGLGMGFWVGEGSIWIRVKACGAWEGVLDG